MLCKVAQGLFSVWFVLSLLSCGFLRIKAWVFREENDKMLSKSLANLFDEVLFTCKPLKLELAGWLWRWCCGADRICIHGLLPFRMLS